jgi:hypothetical protein
VSWIPQNKWRTCRRRPRTNAPPVHATGTSLPTNIFAPVSTPAESIFGLSIFVLLTVAAIFIVVFALLAYAVVRFRKTHGDDHSRFLQPAARTPRVAFRSGTPTRLEKSPIDGVASLFLFQPPQLRRSRYVALAG